MPSEQWKANENDLNTARGGLQLQAEVHGLDMSDPKVIAFIEHQTQVMGSHFAQERWLRTHLHSATLIN